METIPVGFKKLSDVVNKDAAKKPEYSKLKSKVLGLELKNPSTFTLIHYDQYNGDKRDLVKKIEDVQKILDNSELVVTQVFNRLTITNFNARLAEALHLI